MPVRFANKVFLAPMMKAGNPAFRKVAYEMGSHFQIGPMTYANRIRQREPKEIDLNTPFVTHVKPNFEAFCAQITAQARLKDRAEVICDVTESAKILSDLGVIAIEFNACCPKPFALRQRIGASFLRRKNLSFLAELVEALKKAVPLPIAVKIRAGHTADQSSPQIEEMVPLLEKAGADALTLHARYRNERFGSPANWNLIKRAVDAAEKMIIIGNGDIRNWEDVNRMKRETGCSSVAIGRAALQRPWIFQEVAAQRTIPYSPDMRWVVFERLWNYLMSEFIQPSVLTEAETDDLIFDFTRFHAGWYIGWDKLESGWRHTWSKLDFRKLEDQVFFRQNIREIILEGPSVLPPLDFHAFSQQDEKGVHG